MPVGAVVTAPLVVVSVLFPLLSFLSIIFRFQARRTARLDLQADDWWIMAAWLPTVGLSICTWAFGSITGIGTYKIDAATGIMKSLQFLLVCSVILQGGLCAVKISILLFYKRIFLVLLEGDPISASWTEEGHFRFDTVAVGLAQSGTSIALDIAVLMLPLPVLWSLHMRPQKKLGVLLIFWLGAFCCVAAIVRLVLLHASLSKVATDPSMVRLQSKMIIFMLLEPNCSIMAACLPCFGTFFVGGRSLGSMIRSFRSVFSVRSQNSTYSKASARNRSLKLLTDSAEGFRGEELVDTNRIDQRNQFMGNQFKR
ncbi:hypothetical protein BO78DRAFT_414316 [Aspergillus sclerotiicarbonarius CBS 121057]|uniref:Rhodopsin domain-containing protein n=1 Tax=Aspergillus sclerotiicarbonarius (strain CBS 121057 / IBT 28362) TaxID=1448318 RepID=A0A319F4U7_ASPSB|nr:hypothetical protein BO78DRAFT_414316 [Aspergillus sclerotiicarbonarius CBS 121057]